MRLNTTDPFGPASGASKILRGGSWNASAWKVRCTNRFTGNPTLTSPEVGFRCVLAPSAGAPLQEEK